MNQQEIFDHVWKHMEDQDAPAYVDGGCLYKTRDGKMCAVGCLFNDAEMEAHGGNFGGLDSVLGADGGKRVLRRFFHDEQRLLMRLQDAHDIPASSRSSDEFMEDWRCNASRIAAEYDLVIPQPTPVPEKQGVIDRLLAWWRNE